MMKNHETNKNLYIHTVDGRNPAPVDMVDIPFFIWFFTSQVVQDFFHQQYVKKKCSEALETWKCSPVCASTLRCLDRSLSNKPGKTEKSSDTNELAVSTHFKNMLVKLDHFPKVQGKIQNIWNHHLAKESLALESLNAFHLRTLKSRLQRRHP